MLKRKVSVIGAGNVGATTALRIIERNLADVVLVDIAERLAKGKALDISHSCPLLGSNCTIKGTSDYSETTGSDIVVMTAGISLRPEMHPEDLLQTNYQVVKNCVESWMKYCPDAIIIMVTDPLDLMSYVAFRISSTDKKKVLGMSGVVESARLRSILAHKLKVATENISALVIGGRGKNMLPLLRLSSVNSIPVQEILSDEEIEEIASLAKNTESEIIHLLQAGTAFYAPASAIYEMVESIILDKKKVLPCSVFLDGEYNQKGIFLGVPVIVGCSGIEKIIEIPITEEEQRIFNKAANEFNELKKLINLQ